MWSVGRGAQAQCQRHFPRCALQIALGITEGFAEFGQPGLEFALPKASRGKLGDPVRRHQSGADRIKMDIVNDPSQGGGVLNQKGLVPALEQMTVAPMKPVVARCKGAATRRGQPAGCCSRREWAGDRIETTSDQRGRGARASRVIPCRIRSPRSASFPRVIINAKEASQVRAARARCCG